MDNTAEIERIKGLIAKLSEKGMKYQGYQTRRSLIVELEAKLLVLMRKRPEKLYKPVNVSYRAEWDQHWREQNVDLYK